MRREINSLMPSAAVAAMKAVTVARRKWIDGVDLHITFLRLLSLNSLGFCRRVASLNGMDETVWFKIYPSNQTESSEESVGATVASQLLIARRDMSKENSN